MGIPSLVGGHLYIESPPGNNYYNNSFYKSTHDDKSITMPQKVLINMVYFSLFHKLRLKSFMSPFAIMSQGNNTAWGECWWIACIQCKLKANSWLKPLRYTLRGESFGDHMISHGRGLTSQPTHTNRYEEIGPSGIWGNFQNDVHGRHPMDHRCTGARCVLPFLTKSLSQYGIVCIIVWYDVIWPHLSRFYDIYTSNLMGTNSHWK